MDKLIEFTMLFDTLNDEEHPLFVNQLIKSCGMNLLKNALFAYFSERILSHKKYNQNNVIAMNQIVSNIIHSRDSNTANDADKFENDHDDEDVDIDIEVSKEINLDDLAYPLVSKIASFLPTHSFIMFQRANRRVYKGTNTPFSMQEFSFFDKPRNMGTYWESELGQSLTADKLQRLHAFDVGIDDFNEQIYPICNQFTFLNLQKLTLRFCDSDEVITTFLKQNCIDLAKIEALRLEDFGDDRDSHIDG